MMCLIGFFTIEVVYQLGCIQFTWQRVIQYGFFCVVQFVLVEGGDLHY